MTDSGEILPDYRWATIAAFYAAVRYVNAFLFERLDFIPSSHQEREAAIRMFAELRGVLDDYIGLHDAAGPARYSPRFTMAEDQVRTLVDEFLARVRQAVLSNVEPEG
jgi:hypothetical protein